MDTLRLATSQDILADIRGKFENHGKSIDHALETLDHLIDAPEALAWLARIKAVRSHYVLSAARVIELLEEGRQAEAVRLMDAETLPALNAVQGTILGLLDLQRKSLPADNTGAAQQLDSALTMMKVMNGAPEAVWNAPLRGET